MQSPANGSKPTAVVADDARVRLNAGIVKQLVPNGLVTDKFIIHVAERARSDPRTVTRVLAGLPSSSPSSSRVLAVLDAIRQERAPR